MLIKKNNTKKIKNNNNSNSSSSTSYNNDRGCRIPHIHVQLSERVSPGPGAFAHLSWAGHCCSPNTQLVAWWS